MSRRKTPTLQQIAATKFEAFESVEMMRPEVFLEHAKNAYRTVAIANLMFRLNPQELAKALSGADAPDGITGACQEITDTKDWFQGFASALGAMEARCIIAMAIVATGKAGAA
jgi:hypothetical protein